MNDKRELLADKLGIPSDALGAPKLTFFGRSRLLIENHRGIVSYGTELIEIDCGGMNAVIRGDALSLSAMDKNDMLICGRMISLEFS